MLIDDTNEFAARRDDQLITAVQAGAPGAWAELHAAYFPRLYKQILSITRNPEDAEEALQETFLRVHLRLHTFEGRSSISSWMTRIAINSALMILRRRRSRPEMLFDPSPDPREDAPCFEIKDTSLNPEQICDLRQQTDVALKAINALKLPMQAAVLMQMMLGSSMKEIARALNVSEATVKSRLHRARNRLFRIPNLKRSEIRHQGSDLHKSKGHTSTSRDTTRAMQ